MRHVRVILGYLISIGFRGLTGYQQDPRVGASHQHILGMLYCFLPQLTFRTAVLSST